MADRTILVVDDEEAQRKVLSGFLRKRGFDVIQAGGATEALAQARERTLDLVLTDLRMPDRDGLELLAELRRINPEVPAIVMTAFGTVKTAVEAMKRGAADYLTKPIDLDELDLLIDRVLERRALVSENAELRRQVEERHQLQGLETANARMREALSVAARAAQRDVTVLVQGESGTGKELLARAIHYASPRARGPFVAVNVAALPETLLESELFGHERGAFTGADRERRGRFELASGGTLLLDEVGDLPKSTQVKLLRVIQERTIERLGSSRGIEVDVRLLAATNRDLAAMARAGEFREDLFYRLNVVSIELPPLRVRREDIPALVEQFLGRYAPKGIERPQVSREAMDALLKYSYPGNIRELENIIQRAVALARSSLIGTSDLPAYILGLPAEDATGGSLTEQVERLERRLIADALAQSGGVQTRAARMLGISERHLRYKLQKYALDGRGAADGKGSDTVDD
ncbi:MAG TPA: sigma-54 dependent transcriptional regulator [Vicinamibacterales bacterium]|nr:sigma-54 dependent transcriptional regulator [Vicinamibacterales bacterium]